jgi:hypothetical protein
MTQDATVAELLAPFAGETVRDLGFEATMTRTVDGVPHVTMRRDSTSAPPDVILDTDVELSVGSHRYQQYVGRAPDGTRVRLPFAWHVGADRWIPMRAAFLTPDGVPGEADDALRHVTPYDDNCIFCHNTEPEIMKAFCQLRMLGAFCLGHNGCHYNLTEAHRIFFSAFDFVSVVFINRNPTGGFAYHRCNFKYNRSAVFFANLECFNH